MVVLMEALIGCFGAGCGPVNLGPVWYVDSNGDNTNDGSLEAPFETIARAVMYLQWMAIRFG